MREPTIAAIQVESSKNPSTESTPKITFPSHPPSRPPTIPMSMVTMTPPGSLPGMMALAIAPASRPMMIHARIPMVCVPLPSAHKD